LILLKESHGPLAHLGHRRHRGARRPGRVDHADQPGSHGLHDEFLARFDAATRAAMIGDPAGDVLYGPMLDAKFAVRFEGLYYHPVIVDGVRPEDDMTRCAP
jgi:hypothetical protein